MNPSFYCQHRKRHNKPPRRAARQHTWEAFLISRDNLIPANQSPPRNHSRHIDSPEDRARSPHRETSGRSRSCSMLKSKLILFLHQTTTNHWHSWPPPRCNSFYFYIKPQLLIDELLSNLRCNSFYFYIKPQPIRVDLSGLGVVIHSISTSNHNRLGDVQRPALVVIHSISTSNHNWLYSENKCIYVVIHSISTSNHNLNGGEINAYAVVIHSISTSNHNRSRNIEAIIRL